MSTNGATQSLLNDLKIASPCPMLWANMEITVDQAVRFCGDCRKNVYNVADMSADDASMILQRAAAAGSSSCVQLYRRADGTVITDDCPVGLRRIRDFWRRMKSLVAALALVLAALPTFAQSKGSKSVSPLCGTKQVTAKGNKSPLVEGGVLLQFGQPMALGGAPAPMNWRNVAMAVPSVKRQADHIVELQNKGTHSTQEATNILRLRLEMAKDAEKNKVPYFAAQELDEIELAAGKLPDQTTRTGSNAKNMLLKDILIAKLSNSKILGVTNTTAIEEQLTKLESER
jgi:hypothetical protein